MIEPAKPSALLEVLAALAPLEEEFPPIAELDLNPVELRCAISCTEGVLTPVSRRRKES
jgi:hypothetical protein